MVEGLSCFLPKEPPGGAESAQRQAGLGTAVHAKGTKKLRPDIPGMYHFLAISKLYSLESKAPTAMFWVRGI